MCLTGSTAKQGFRLDSGNIKFLFGKSYWIFQAKSVQKRELTSVHVIMCHTKHQQVFLKQLLPMLNMLPNHRTLKSIWALVPFANVEITKGLTVTFYNNFCFSAVHKEMLIPWEFNFLIFFYLPDCEIKQSQTNYLQFSNDKHANKNICRKAKKMPNFFVMQQKNKNCSIVKCFD